MPDEPVDGGTVRWGAGGEPHARIPEWLLDADVSDKAIRVYAVLSRYADGEGRAFPGKPRLMERLGCSRSTLDAAMGALKKAGALSWKPRRRDDGGFTSNDYELHWLAPESRVTPSGGSAGGTSGGPGVKERRTRTNVGKENPPTPPSGPAAPKLVLVNGQNLAFDALAEECGIDPASNRVGLIATALNTNNRKTPPTRGIRDLFRQELSRWAADEHGAEEADGWLAVELAADPERFEKGLARAVHRKAGLYRQKMPGAFMTPTALRDHWLDLERGVPRPDGGLTPEQIRAMDL